MFVSPRYSESDARAAIAGSLSWSEALRKLGMRAAGGNFKTLQRYAHEVWHIPVEHFDAYARSRMLPRRKQPLDEILVSGSTYSRNHLKERLYDEGVKLPVCELCGQGDRWRGQRMALILDHVNGVGDDNRLENLRIVCPNCAATLSTHCGRNKPQPSAEATCARCGKPFLRRRSAQRHCSAECGRRWDRTGRIRPGARRVQRPPYEQLVREIAATSYVAVGRKYGVSDNAVRKWLRQYEREAREVRLPRAA